MRVAELMRYTQAFDSSWDAAYAEQLREQFGLDPESACVRTLAQRAAREIEIETESRELPRWLDAIPRSRLVVTNRSGHNVRQEQPELVVDTIRQAVNDATRRLR